MRNNKNFLFIANFAYWAHVNAASCVSTLIVMAKKLTTRCGVLLLVSSELRQESTVSWLIFFWHTPPFCMWHALVTRQLLIEWYMLPTRIYHSMFHGYTLLLRLWTPARNYMQNNRLNVQVVIHLYACVISLSGITPTSMISKWVILHEATIPLD